eukprot:gnl/TRDRNA2_/TRDRNA2_146317_c0_seq2.p1 gnl/TRDRNA2_/TRDRNA2_146317_c0~~gnl/TRDRNA2_/TRDRNA2_146317_c0_seq2.p1  ORF type:complete len:190 (-),score=18.14 gnl/TRDRNA2_/TRDRNA2_146317_c0_seq2:22-591(-)
MCTLMSSRILGASRDNMGTGSTWLFNAVRLLFRQAHEACDSYWIRKITAEKIKKRLETGAHVVVKTHEWTPHISRAEFDELLPVFTHVIVNERKGRDSDPTWTAVATMSIAYEDIVAHDPNDPLGAIGALSVLRRVAEHLGLMDLDDSDFRAVDMELMTLPVPTGSCNQTTKLWPHHARRGGRPPPKAE